MTFRIKNLSYNPPELMRRLGYKPLRYTEKGELNCVRPLGGDYPRFHIYLQAEQDIIKMNLHLDQKKPSYEGTSAHGGEYEGDTVQSEMDRILENLG